MRPEVLKRAFQLAQAIADDADPCIDGEVDKLVWDAIGEWTPEEWRIVAMEWVSDHAHSFIRTATRRAEMHAVSPVEEEKPPVAKDDLYLGKWEHGSWSQRRGAAIRGCTCEECETAKVGLREIGEFERQSQLRFAEEMKRITDDYVASIVDQLKMEWTQELLSSTFGLGNGVWVTWGTATIEDHKQRADMLTKKAMGNAEAAARHLKAVQDIEKAGARTLKEAITHEVAYG